MNPAAWAADGTYDIRMRHGIRMPYGVFEFAFPYAYGKRLQTVFAVWVLQPYGKKHGGAVRLNGALKAFEQNSRNEDIGNRTVVPSPTCEI